MLGGESACVCVLGESGAGKSEASKLALLHVLHRGGELRGVGGGGPDEPLRRALLLSLQPYAPSLQPDAPSLRPYAPSLRPYAPSLQHVLQVRCC